jgi:hypothetical protein
MTKRKPTKKVVQEPAAPVDMSASDRAALIAAYQAGIISAWKHDGERGYRLTVPGRADDYVEPAKLTSYLEKLRGAA